MARAEPPCCAACGVPFAGELAVARLCQHCEELAPGWAAGRTLVRYVGPARPLVQHLKYRGGRHLLEDVAAIARDAPGIVDFLAGAVLVPVPLHARRERERGYNQSALIAAALARVGRGAGVAHLLRRVRDTASQTRLDRLHRAANVNNAFAMSPSAVLDARLDYILIDDVFTTGSTLQACTTVLRAAGAASVRVPTLAHG